MPALAKRLKKRRSGGGIVSSTSSQDRVAEDLLRQIFDLGRALLEATQLKERVLAENAILKEVLVA